MLKLMTSSGLCVAAILWSALPVAARGVRATYTQAVLRSFGNFEKTVTVMHTRTAAEQGNMVFVTGVPVQRGIELHRLTARVNGLFGAKSGRHFCFTEQVGGKLAVTGRCRSQDPATIARADAIDANCPAAHLSRLTQ